MADDQQTNAAPPPAEHRRFGYWVGHFVVVGSMIGAGILTTSGTLLRDTGNPLALLALWALGGALGLCGALAVAELATALPRSGGDYVFVRAAFGRGAGFVSGWATFALGFAAPTAVVAHLALKYLTAPYAADLAEFLPPWIAAHVIPLGATLLIITVGVIHTLGHRHSSGLQALATAVTAAVLLAVALGGVLFGRGDWNYLSAGAWPGAQQWPLLAGGLVYVSYSYAGWNGAGYLAGEIRDPARTLPRCLVGGTLSVTALYLLVNLAFVYALDPEEMTARSKDEVQPVAELAVRALFGSTAASVVAVALGLCLVATVSAFVLTGPRVAFAMARDGAFPAFAGRLHATRLTPVPATLTLALAAAALVWAGSFLELLDYASVGLAALTGLTVASVFPLRRRTDLPHPYRMPLYPVPPLAFLVLTALTIGSALVDEGRRVPGLLSLATLLVGVPLSRLIPNGTGLAEPSAGSPK
ncbi:MAG: amino acid permease [Planctomycetes bacterium]|nr:amino acid permease [Planctomycetota bacterium]